MGGILTGSQAAPPQVSIASPPVSKPPPGNLNVFAYPAKLSPDLRRVAVLPLAAESAGGDLLAGCDNLSPVLWEQLLKTKKFEVVTVDASTLRQGTGRLGWTGGETLSSDFLAFMRREYGVDGVLFSELTTYRGYAPLAIGWRLKLVDARSGQIVWAADELFDAATPSVMRAAKRFADPKPFWYFGHGEDWLAVNSPRQLGRYSVATLLGKLPER